MCREIVLQYKDYVACVADYEQEIWVVMKEEEYYAKKHKEVALKLKLQVVKSAINHN